MVMPSRARRPRRMATVRASVSVADLEEHLPKSELAEAFSNALLCEDHRATLSRNGETTRREGFIVAADKAPAAQPHLDCRAAARAATAGACQAWVPPRHGLDASAYR